MGIKFEIDELAAVEDGVTYPVSFTTGKVFYDPRHMYAVIDGIMTAVLENFFCVDQPITLNLHLSAGARIQVGAQVHEITYRAHDKNKAEIDIENITVLA